MVWLGAAAAFVVAFLFRWLTLSEFPNDHFDHVALAQQLRLGAWPVRDFTDEGMPLAYVVSAVAWSLARSPFLSEAIVVSLGFAIAAALTFLAVARLSRSSIAASVAVLAQVMVYPRTYSYPKLLVQAVAIAVACWAIERLNTRRLAALAATTALGYYFRHDHAVHIGAATIALLAVVRWPMGLPAIARTVAQYTAMVIAFVLPHLLYVQWAAGLPTYLAISRNYVMAESAAGQYRVPRPHLVPAAGLWVRRDTPTVSVRWTAATDAAARVQLEQRFALERVGHTDETTWQYRLRDTGAANMASLRSSPSVDDTHGFDRISDARVRGLQLGPGWRARENSLAVLYWWCWLIPAVALIAAVATRRTMTTTGAAGAAMLIVLAVFANLGFLRSPLDMRLPDVAVPQAVLAAWLGTTLWRWPSTRRGQVFRRGLVLIATAKAVIAITVLSQTGQLLLATGIASGPAGVAQRVADVTAERRAAFPGPVPNNPSRVLLPFLEYVRECTGPDDHLLYAWYSPEVYVVADRPFAGDHRKFVAPFHSSSWEQARTLDRLTRQRVPFVLIPKERRQSFETGYPEVWQYVRSRYVPMTTIPEGDPAGIEILRESNWFSDRLYRDTSWPCAGSRRSGAGPS